VVQVVRAALALFCCSQSSCCIFLGDFGVLTTQLIFPHLGGFPGDTCQQNDLSSIEMWLAKFGIMRFLKKMKFPSVSVSVNIKGVREEELQVSPGKPPKWGKISWVVRTPKSPRKMQQLDWEQQNRARAARTTWTTGLDTTACDARVGAGHQDPGSGGQSWGENLGPHEGPRSSAPWAKQGNTTAEGTQEKAQTHRRGKVPPPGRTRVKSWSLCRVNRHPVLPVTVPSLYLFSLCL